MPKHGEMTSREAQAAETRKNLLAVAKRMFADKGYSATSVRSINRELGLADGILYHYFPDGKHEILQTLLEEGIKQRSETMDVMLKSLDRELSMKDTLVTLTWNMRTILLGDLDLLQIQFKERDLVATEYGEKIFSFVKQQQLNLAIVIQEKADSGQIRVMDYEMAARQFTSSIIMIVWLYLSGVQFIDEAEDEYIEKVVLFTLQLWAKE
jgi:AcrR family transcriptional regulator